MKHIKTFKEMFGGDEDTIELNGKYMKDGSPADYLEVGYGISVHFENSEEMDFLELEQPEMWEIISTISGCKFKNENEIELDGTVENDQVSMYRGEYDVAVSLYYDKSENGIFVKWHNNRDGSISTTNLLDLVDAVEEELDAYVWDILVSIKRGVYKG